MKWRLSLPMGGEVSAPGGSASGSSLPTEMLEVAARRLALLAAIYAVVYFVTVFLLPRPPLWQTEPYLTQHYVGSAVFITIAAIAAAVLRSGKLSGRQIVLAGFILEIYGAIGIEWDILVWGSDPRFVQLGLSWTAVWIIGFPLILPSPPLRTFIVATIAASIRPLMLLILAVRGVVLPDLSTLVLIVAPTYICVGIATAGAVVIYGLRRDVTRARRMGSYRLIDKLGAGGMGEVWTAEHQLLARTAALKLMRPGKDTARGGAQLRRFEREVQATAQLRSPHTVEIYDYGFTNDGTFYYVMELLSGIDLDHLIHQYGPVPDGRVIRILRQVCHSLGEAHDLGLIHRDIKPGNIFLCRSGRDYDVAKVLDFGLVKMTRTPSAEDEHLTLHGAFYGTPLYASPEMARGEVDDVGALTDIYSLGCVAYWLLTGRPVFTAASPMGVLVQHNSAVPDPPSEHSAEPIADALEDVVLRCLAKDAADRPSADDLSVVLDNITPRHPWTDADARRWWTDVRPVLAIEASPSPVSPEHRPSRTLVTPENASD